MVTSREALRVRGEKLIPVRAALVRQTLVRAPPRAKRIWGWRPRSGSPVRRAGAGGAQPDFTLTDANAAAVADICAPARRPAVWRSSWPPRGSGCSLRLPPRSAGQRLHLLRGGAATFRSASARCAGRSLGATSSSIDDERARLPPPVGCSPVPADRCRRAGRVAAAWLAGVDVVDCPPRSRQACPGRRRPARAAPLDARHDPRVRHRAARTADPDCAAAVRLAHADLLHRVLACPRAAISAGTGPCPRLDELAGDLGNLQMAWPLLRRGRPTSGGADASCSMPCGRCTKRAAGITVRVTLVKDLARGAAALPPERRGREARRSRCGSASPGSCWPSRDTPEEVEKLYREASPWPDRPRRVAARGSSRCFGAWRASTLYRAEIDKAAIVGARCSPRGTRATRSLRVEGHLILGPAACIPGTGAEPSTTSTERDGAVRSRPAPPGPASASLRIPGVAAQGNLPDSSTGWTALPPPDHRRSAREERARPCRPS